MSDWTSGGPYATWTEEVEATSVVARAVWSEGEIIAFESEIVTGPRFPKARVSMGYFMMYDAMYHMMLEAVAQLRKAGATPEQVQQYREEAINGSPWAVTPRWVTTGSTIGVRNG